jgi:hypothetical protein
MQTKSDIALVVPTGKSEQLPLVGVPTPYRKREHLTETEIRKLIEAAKGNRYGHRDATRSYRRPGSRTFGQTDRRLLLFLSTTGRTQRVPGVVNVEPLSAFVQDMPVRGLLTVSAAVLVYASVRLFVCSPNAFTKDCMNSV